MPPQQAYGLLDFVDNVQHFRAHGVFFSLCSLQGLEMRWDIVAPGADVKAAPGVKKIRSGSIQTGLA
jgi:hypothetical protein